MLGLGIDTGGTCTDAVVYDFEKKAVLASAKTLTTHQDLKIGITEILRLLPADLLGQCGQAALSTTLATNTYDVRVKSIVKALRLVRLHKQPKGLGARPVLGRWFLAALVPLPARVERERAQGVCAT